MKFGFIEHFRSQYWTTAKKRKSFSDCNKDNKKREPDHDKNDKTEIDYLFRIKDDEIITCKIGGIDTKRILDLGSKCIIINDTTWNHMKSNTIKAFNQIRNPEKTLMAYGCKNPLEVLSSFETNINVGAKSETAKFYVVKNSSKHMLAKTSGKSLGVLKVGWNINAISDGAFPKFKDVQVVIPIDKSIKPVVLIISQDSNTTEIKINYKLQELVRMDIIEPVNNPLSSKK